MAIVRKFQRAVLSGDRGDQRRSIVMPDMEKLFQAVVQTPDVAPSSEPLRDHDTACDILDRAVSAFDALMTRSRELEAELVEAKAKLHAETGRVETTTANWTRLADGMRAHAHECEQRLKEMTARAEAAETKFAEVLIRAETAELQFANLQNRSTRLHDKVVSSFGIGSRAQVMLESAPPDLQNAAAIAMH